MPKWKLAIAACAVLAAAVAPTVGDSPATAAGRGGSPSPTASHSGRPRPSDSAEPSPTGKPGGGPTAAQLMAKLAGCKQVSHGLFKKENGSSATVPICGKKGAVFYKADMDVDCDGQRTAQCNEKTDCCFQPRTTFHQSDGKSLNAAQLPYSVLPRSSDRFKWTDFGIAGGTIVAIIYKNKVQYAVVGDTDSPDKIGEASYATAKSLGINPDPKHGGVSSSVTYIVFANTVAKPIESHSSAVSLGQQAAQKFLSSN